MSNKKILKEQEINVNDNNVKIDLQLIWEDEKNEVDDGDNISQRQSNKNRI